MKIILADLVKELAAANAQSFGGLGRLPPQAIKGRGGSPGLDLGQQVRLTRHRSEKSKG